MSFTIQSQKSPPYLWMRDHEAEKETPEYLFFQKIRDGEQIHYTTEKSPWEMKGRSDEDFAQVIPLVSSEPCHSQKILKIFSVAAECLNTERVLNHLASLPNSPYKNPYFVEMMPGQSLMVTSKFGVSLSELLEQPQTWEMRLQIIHQLAQQLLLFQQENIFHGDIHNGNIVCKEVAGEMRCAFIDFEQAIFLNKNDASQVWKKNMLALVTETEEYLSKYAPAEYRRQSSSLSVTASDSEEEDKEESVEQKDDKTSQVQDNGSLDATKLAERNFFLQKVDERCLSMVFASVIGNRPQPFDHLFALWDYQTEPPSAPFTQEVSDEYGVPEKLYSVICNMATDPGRTKMEEVVAIIDQVIRERQEGLARGDLHLLFGDMDADAVFE